MKDNQTSTHGINAVYINAPEKPIKIETVKDPIIEMLKEKFDERSQVGINKYGTTLAENNDDDFLMHLLEELMDASAYIMRIISERNNSK
jgi:hypothetical protein